MKLEEERFHELKTWSFGKTKQQLFQAAVNKVWMVESYAIQRVIVKRLLAITLKEGEGQASYSSEIAQIKYYCLDIN